MDVTIQRLEAPTWPSHQKINGSASPGHRKDGSKVGGWDWRYTSAVVISALLFQALTHWDPCDGAWWFVAELNSLHLRGV